MARKPMAPVEMSLWRRTPPAVFPALLGLFGLGLGWRQGAVALELPSEVAELILGGVTLIFLFAFLAYLVKFFWRPPVAIEDLRVLPGRAGLAAMILCLYLLVLTLHPYIPNLLNLFYAALIGHLLLVILLIWVFLSGPPEQRRVTPVWHLSFVGFIIGALAAIKLNLGPLSLLLFAITVLMAAAIWAVSAERLITERVPQPLRPLLAIHLSPAALFGLVAQSQDLEVVAVGFACLSAALLAALVLHFRWLTVSGFSALWGAFTFPLAATANLWLTLGGVWLYPGIAALLAATVLVPWIAYRVLKLWLSGKLAVVTNAATA